MVKLEEDIQILYKKDRVLNLYERMRESDRPNVKKMTRLDAREIINIYDKLFLDFFLDAHEYGFSAISLGDAGFIKIKDRKGYETRDVATGERIQIKPTPMYYFSPSEKLKKLGNEAYREQIRKQEEQNERGFFWNG